MSTCPSNHYNDGTDYCADCGTDLQAPYPPPPQFPAHQDHTWEFNEETGNVISRWTPGPEYDPELIAEIHSDQAADPGDADGHIMAASRYMLSLLKEVIAAGSYDDDGDFILYHREGPGGPKDDHRDPEVIEKVNALIQTLGSTP